MFKINKFLYKSIISKITHLKPISLDTYSNTFNKINKASFSNKNDDLKNKFNKMMEEQGISNDQVRQKKEEEEKRLQEEQRQSKIKYEEDSQKLKDRFSRLKAGIKDDEIEIDLGKIKQKFTSFLFAKKKKVETPEEKKETDKIKETTESKSKDDPILNASTNIKEEINKEKVNETEKNKINENINKSQTQSQTESPNDQKTNQNLNNKDAANEEKAKVEKPFFKNKKLNKFIVNFKDLWNKTFPGEENIEIIMQARRERAKLIKSLIKEPTEEEIAEVKFK